MFLIARFRKDVIKEKRSVANVPLDHVSKNYNIFSESKSEIKKNVSWRKCLLVSAQLLFKYNLVFWCNSQYNFNSLILCCFQQGNMSAQGSDTVSSRQPLLEYQEGECLNLFFLRGF